MIKSFHLTLSILAISSSMINAFTIINQTDSEKEVYLANGYRSYSTKIKPQSKIDAKIEVASWKKLFRVKVSQYNQNEKITIYSDHKFRYRDGRKFRFFIDTVPSNINEWALVLHKPISTADPENRDDQKFGYGILLIDPSLKDLTTVEKLPQEVIDFKKLAFNLNRKEEKEKEDEQKKWDGTIYYRR